MEAKLKALKVPELKQILTRAGIPIPSKANKADLIAKIISEPSATAVANGEDPSSTNGHVQTSSAAATSSKPANTASNSADDEKLKDLLAPPEEFDWDSAVQPTTTINTTINDTKPSTERPSATEAAVAVADTAASAPSIAASKAIESTTDTAAENTAASALDKEKQLELHRARAARFGIPFIEPKEETKARTKPQPQFAKAARTKTSNVANGKSGKSVTATAPGDSETQLKARAERFDIIDKPVRPADDKVSGRKRQAEEVADPEELEKRRKRAERFGMPVRA